MDAFMQMTQNAGLALASKSHFPQISLIPFTVFPLKLQIASTVM